jgi:hypothetical protein
VDLFKGITPEQKMDILKEQEAQRVAALAKREEQRQEEARWALQEAVNVRASLLLEREKARQARQMAVEIREMNTQKAAEDKEKYVFVCVFCVCACARVL